MHALAGAGCAVANQADETKNETKANATGKRTATSQFGRKVLHFQCASVNHTC
jgi:hypothetical protein